MVLEEGLGRYFWAEKNRSDSIKWCFLFFQDTINLYELN